MEVSIVIPAYNAAETIAQTLASVQAQTFPNWEAIVVDDGSSDETVALANQFAAKDSRIRLLSQPNQGVSAARNTGIGLTNFDWLLFLDADDWLSPKFLERMTEAIAYDSSRDAVHCGARRVAPDGGTFYDQYGPELTDLFPVFARQCPILLQSSVIRKALVEVVGGFDTGLRTHEDWDFWQRIARTGARFGAVREVLAFYRMRSNSLSRDTNHIFADAMRVITQGHAPDPRVPNPHPRHVEGQPKEALPSMRLGLSAYYAGFSLGRGEDARHLLKLLVNDRDPSLEPKRIANNIFKTALLTTCQLPAAWEKLWPSVEGCIKDFLVALEAQSQATGLARRTGTILERMVLQHSQVREPLMIGATHAIRLEVTKSISDICPPKGAERLYCIVEMEGTELGRLELPVCDGLVASWVIKDAIAGTEALRQAVKIKKPSPTIIVDGVFFQFPKAKTKGIARVWRSLLEEWADNGFAKHIVVLDRDSTAPAIPGIRYRPVEPYDHDRTDADRQMLQQVCDEEGADLLISSYYTTPLSTPSVFLAYDMIPEVLKRDLNAPAWREKHYGIQHASAYIAVSENTARDLVKFFPQISLETVTVAHCGVNHKIFSPATPEDINRFRARYVISKPYFILVGSKGGYKNPILFFKAFAQLGTRQDFEIVCTGNGSFSEELRDYTSDSNVVHALQLSDEDLRAAYSGAIALVYPSKYEGFGLPILESLACGCPVITCPNASIPEVAGEAALYVKDHDVNELVNALCEVQNPEVRNSLIVAGIEQAKKFSWSKMAAIISSTLIDICLAIPRV